MIETVMVGHFKIIELVVMNGLVSRRAGVGGSKRSNLARREYEAPLYVVFDRSVAFLDINIETLLFDTEDGWCDWDDEYRHRNYDNKARTGQSNR